MNFFHILFDQTGLLFITIPSALIILISRTWFASKMAGEKDAQPLADFSIASFACLTLTGAAPGGLIQNKPLPLLRFLYGQLWLVFLILMGILYAAIKGPAPDTFAARFSAVFISQAWATFLFNFIPLPPFDAAAGYFSAYTQWRFFAVLVTALTFIVLVILSFDFWRTNFITGGFLLQWLKLT
ncbi:MAG TPA: hypothetical protein PLY93_04910 [Turneriella sp.]|nr:hypothetical protein [Turneriella sp.]